MSAPTGRIDYPELIGHEMGLAIIIGKLFEFLLRRGVATREEVATMFRHGDMRACYVCEALKELTSPEEAERIKSQAILTIYTLADDVGV